MVWYSGRHATGRGLGLGLGVPPTLSLIPDLWRTAHCRKPCPNLRGHAQPLCYPAPRARPAPPWRCYLTHPQPTTRLRRPSDARLYSQNQTEFAMARGLTRRCARGTPHSTYATTQPANQATRAASCHIVAMLPHQYTFIIRTHTESSTQ